MLIKRKMIYAGLIASILAITATVAVAGTFFPGYCTWGVANIKGDTKGDLWWTTGDARGWYDKAKAAKIIPTAPPNATGSNDKRGAIIVFGGTGFGHVAVSLGNGKFIEMNGNPCGGLDKATGKCRTTFGKFTESTWSIGGGLPVLGYIYYNLTAVCPPKGSAWYGAHPSCP